ncbi:hypothetical protein HNR19_001221 [Nocardioides thalensis]|uniref:Lipoprotein n=1 Tax=Nocardioides thalensis TaxID=1914755 RepID=A0A853C2E9_9ACTN|nr:hypothetical protein [Nocardioides thalensis]NYJ00523.1 hypothetical protein [Nocardioides thalensis]
MGRRDRWGLLTAGLLLSIGTAACSAEDPEAAREPHFGEPPESHTIEDVPLPAEAFAGNVEAVAREYRKWEVETSIAGSRREVVAAVDAALTEAGLQRFWFSRRWMRGRWVDAGVDVTVTFGVGSSRSTLVSYQVTVDSQMG